MKPRVHFKYFSVGGSGGMLPRKFGKLDIQKYHFCDISFKKFSHNLNLSDIFFDISNIGNMHYQISLHVHFE